MDNFSRGSRTDPATLDPALATSLQSVAKVS